MLEFNAYSMGNFGTLKVNEQLQYRAIVVYLAVSSQMLLN